MTRDPFADGEWYHCFTRGVDKRRTFESKRDYERFMHVLYLCNSDVAVHRSDFNTARYEDVFTHARGKPFVHIGAYCLMPNHFHILLRQVRENGVTDFMRKVGTAYTMYFNIKSERTGNLFVKPFRSRHVGDDRYAQRVASYIHLNPVALVEPQWKEGVIRSLKQLERFLDTYRYSSLGDYRSSRRPEKHILDADSMELFREHAALSQSMLDDALQYYAELARTNVKVSP